jgi:protein-S-isoprenylcysteine O-methyltransferase Ste14
MPPWPVGCILGILGASTIAAYTVYNGKARDRGARAHWAGGLLLAILGMSLAGASWTVLALSEPEFGPLWIRTPGAILCGASLAVYGLSARSVGRWRSPTRYSLGLRTEGIYSRVRHPQALSLILLVLGLPLVSRSLPSLLSAPLWVLYWIAYTYLEERFELLPAFGEEYRRYSQATPRLIPRLVGGPPTFRRGIEGLPDPPASAPTRRG